MDFKEYQKESSRTRNKSIPQHQELLNYGLGLGGEVGELLNLVKKRQFHGSDNDENLAKILDEAGDVLWYLAGILEILGFSLDDVAEFNINKLKMRYPEGFKKLGN